MVVVVVDLTLVMVVDVMVTVMKVVEECKN